MRPIELPCPTCHAAKGNRCTEHARGAGNPNAHVTLAHYHAARVDEAMDILACHARAAMATAGEALLRLGMTAAQASASCEANLRNALLDDAELHKALKR